MATGCATLDPVVIPGPMAGPLADAAIPAPTSPAWAIAGVGPGAGARGAWIEPRTLCVERLYPTVAPTRFHYVDAGFAAPSWGTITTPEQMHDSDDATQEVATYVADPDFPNGCVPRISWASWSPLTRVRDIAKVRFVARVKKTGSSDCHFRFLGNTRFSPGITISTDWVTCVWESTVDPADGLPWTAARLADWALIVYITHASGATTELHISEYYIEVYGQPTACAGVEAPEHDGQWFERIHVMPRSTYLGYVAEDTDVSVIVWNAWRRSRSLTAINVTGHTGVSVLEPGYPQAFAPLQHREHLITVAVLGDPEIDNRVVWEFAGVSSVGSDLAITGWRVILYTHHPNGEVSESYGYLTRLFRAYDGTEQRSLLRARPSREVRIRTTATTMAQLQRLVAQLYTVGHYPYGVPLWMDAAVVTSYVGLGATEVPLSAAGRALAAGGMCLLYQDPDNWETRRIESVESDHLHLSTVTGRGWAAGTLCVPVLIARILDPPEIQRPCGGVADVVAGFSIEPHTSVAAPCSGALDGTQLDGVDVLTETQHNARDAISETFARHGALFNNPTGARVYDDHGAQAFPERNFLWTAADRAACVRLREFLDARQGRRVPFWTPTFSWDLELAEDAPPSSSTLVVRTTTYGQLFWPVPARRRLAIFAPGQPMVTRRVTIVVAGAATDTLHLDSGLGDTTLFAASTRVCFLVLCRLAEDQTEITWSHTDHCDAQIRFVEIPNEISA
jgi:hypothetical protein